MINLRTITTIELSSACNLACKYCVSRMLMKHPARTPGIMSDDVFEASIRLLRTLRERGTQCEVNLNGNGESLLDPQIVSRAAAVCETMGASGVVQFSTNGILLTRQLATGLRDAGIKRVDVSIHSPYHARRAMHILMAAGIPGQVTAGAVFQPHNWAGQLEPEHSVADEHLPQKFPCHPLMEGRGYISSEGHVSPCCFDYRLLGAFGHVMDDDLMEKPIRPYSLCHDCHQEIPAYLQDEEDFEQRERAAA
jgi:hypothetical protein